jgi:uncharacterized protein (TIGR02145 family)
MKRRLLIFSLGLLSLTVIIGAFLMSSSVSADDSVVDDVSISVPVSCSLSGTGMSTHNANIANGTYQANIGTTTIKAFCNDTNGFAIYAIGFSNEEYGNTNLIGASSSTNIVTGTATSAGNPDTSNWAMKLAADSNATYPITLDNSFNAYHIIPSTYTKVAHRDSGTDTGSSATGASLTSTYAAYISKTQSADAYNGKVKYTLVHPASEEPLQPRPATAGCINYFANASTSIGEMGCQSVSNNASVDLWASNFKREGYGFAGWNDKYDYSGTFYGPNETITAPSDVQTNGLSLYAVWIKSAGTIQNWDGCSSLASGATTALTDERDGNVYAVAKLADGKCWTIENLRLDDSAELSSSNTHNPSLPLNNSWYYKNQQGTLSTSNHLSATSDPTSTNPDTAWCQANASACDNQSMLATNNTTLFTNNTSTSYSSSSNVYGYGNYYNWYSATAGHGTFSKASGNTAGDICPAGWHLPTGGSATADFGALDVAMDGTGDHQSTTEASNRWRTYPNNFVYSGGVSGSSMRNRNSFGLYWSSSADDSNYAYYLYFHSSYIYPGTESSVKYAGRMVRCVAGV